MEVDLPPFNPELKAREVIRQYSVAVMQNDIEGLKKTIDAPFLAYGNQIMENKQDAERYVEGNNIPGRNQGTLLMITGTVAVAKYKEAPHLQSRKSEGISGAAFKRRASCVSSTCLFRTTRKSIRTPAKSTPFTCGRSASR